MISQADPQPDLALPTMRLEVKNGLRIAFQKENKKKPGSASWSRYEVYKGCTTTTAALACGCSMAHLIWDRKHNFVEIFDPALSVSHVELGQLADDSAGIKYSEWDVACLVLLPKKGDLSLCKNRR